MVYNPFTADTTKMSSEEFEIYIKNLMDKLISNYNLDYYSIEHDKKIDTYDGTYQIDVFMRYEMMGIKYLTLIECKKYTHPVPREKVEILHNRIKSLGAHKGILFSTARFQSGALLYAETHNIALIQIVDGQLLYETRSLSSNSPSFTQCIKTNKYKSLIIKKKNDSTYCSVFEPENDKQLLFKIN